MMRIMDTQRRRGSFAVGKRQPAKETLTYDPESGRKFRLSVSFEPDDAMLLIETAKRANLSLSGMVNAVIKNMELAPDTGLPTFMDSPAQFGEAS